MSLFSAQDINAPVSIHMYEFVSVCIYVCICAYCTFSWIQSLCIDYPKEITGFIIEDRKRRRKGRRKGGRKGGERRRRMEGKKEK